VDRSGPVAVSGIQIREATELNHENRRIDTVENEDTQKAETIRGQGRLGHVGGRFWSSLEYLETHDRCEELLLVRLNETS